MPHYAEERANPCLSYIGFSCSYNSIIICGSWFQLLRTESTTPQKRAFSTRQSFSVNSDLDQFMAFGHDGMTPVYCTHQPHHSSPALHGEAGLDAKDAAAYRSTIVPVRCTSGGKSRRFHGL